MMCIGKIDEDRGMLEQIEDYSVPSATGVGSYDVKDLKPNDKEFIKGMAAMIDVVDQVDVSDFIDTGSDKMDEMLAEMVDNVVHDIVVSMLAELGMNMYSIMDNDEDYWEKDNEG